MHDLLDFIILETLASWAWLAGTFALLLVIPRFLGLRVLSGVSIAQVTLAINVIPIISGMATESISLDRALHFFAIEFGFLVIVVWVYGRLLTRRQEALVALDRFFAGRGALVLVGVMAFVCAFNLAVVPTDGSSRIEYMTYDWFPYLKPFFMLAMPLAYVGVFVMLRRPGRRALLVLLLLLTVVANIYSGSKASFVIGLGTAFLVVRDLTQRLEQRTRRADKWVLAFVSGLLAIVALYRLEVTASGVGDRVLLTSDATILVYFSDDPTAASRGVSIFAKMHRGLARALGDSSANDIDTLFGFAINLLQTGRNTFTGPNARLSAYFLCNFPGALIFCGFFVVGAYFCLLRLVFRQSAPHPALLAIVCPYAFTSLGIASQDFNLIMADITISVLLLLVTLVLSSIERRPAPAPEWRQEFGRPRVAERLDIPGKQGAIR